MKTVLTCLFTFFVISLSCFSQVLEVKTVTEALNYSGNRETVKKLIITDSIKGTDYSEGSEWREFRRLYIPFPNLDTVEVLTDQNIPDWYSGIYDDGGFFTGAAWLKHFSAPNIKKIGEDAFNYCVNLETINMPAVEIIGGDAFYSCYALTSVDFPLATNIGFYAFAYCSSLDSINFPLLIKIERLAFLHCDSLVTANFPLVTTIEDRAFMECLNLTSINFPLVTNIEDAAFGDCENLTSIAFGTGFYTQTEINFGEWVFYLFEYYPSKAMNMTPYIELILGENVLPKPDINANTWQKANDEKYDIDYIWKNIKVAKTNINEAQTNYSLNIFPNPTNNFTTISLNLEKNCNLEINLYDITGYKVKKIYNDFVEKGLFTKTINIENLAKNIYFIEIFIDNSCILKKLIIN